MFVISEYFWTSGKTSSCIISICVWLTVVSRYRLDGCVFLCGSYFYLRCNLTAHVSRPQAAPTRPGAAAPQFVLRCPIGYSQKLAVIDTGAWIHIYYTYWKRSWGPVTIHTHIYIPMHMHSCIFISPHLVLVDAFFCRCWFWLFRRSMPPGRTRPFHAQKTLQGILRKGRLRGSLSL